MTAMAFGNGWTAILLVAPMGASAVLIFAVPASPLAQPWSVIGGNVISAVVGVGIASMVSSPALASGAWQSEARSWQCRCCAVSTLLAGLPH
ncbi:HPP family protein [Sphingomonas sp. H160509]|uniref:HPP family protein n=1 Tax=Sphingomonas sp. H160509 TaxID=2955313 RepID=UPI00406CCE93